MTGRVLVLRPGAIGDTLLTAPALQALRRRFPERPVHVVGNARALPILAAMGLVDQSTSFDDPAVMRLFAAGDPPPTDPFGGLEAAVAWCADPDGVLARSLGRRGAATPVIARSRPDLAGASGERAHVARHLVQTLAPLGIDASAPLAVPPIEVPTGAVAAAEQEHAAAGVEAGRYAVVHPGSGSPAKNWPAERFAEVVERLWEEHALSAIVLAGPADADVVARLQACLTRPAPLVADRPLLVLAETLRRGRVFLGNDSGLSHLAGLVGTPTLALFGPTDPALWTPLGPRVRVLRHQPLADLPTAAVLRELASLLA